MVKTQFVDSNSRIINSANSVHNPRKKVYFVRKRGPDGKFIKAYGRVAHARKDGRNIANHKTVPRRIRKKRIPKNGMNLRGNLNRLPKYEVTMDSISKWHKHLFEHFGWMILAKSKGYKYKIATYKKSINEFLKSAKALVKVYKETNKCHDIKILFKHAKVLRTFAKML